MRLLVFRLLIDDDERVNLPATSGCKSGGQWGGKLIHKQSKLDAITRQKLHDKQSYFKQFEVV